MISRKNFKVAFSHIYEGFVLSGVAEVEPGCDADEFGPAYGPEVVDMHELFIDGKYAADLLNPDVEKWLHERILSEVEDYE